MIRNILFLIVITFASCAHAQINYGAAPTVGFQQCPNANGQLVNCSGGSFANAPGSPGTGQQYFATDIGPSGCGLVYNGSIWKAYSGFCVLANDPTSHTITGTGAEANVFTVTIPANLMGATSFLEIIGQPNHGSSSINGTKNYLLRHSSTSGAVTGGNLLLNSQCGGSSSTKSAQFNLVESNTTTTSQVFYPATNCYIGNASSSNLSLGSIATSSSSYLNFNINASSSSDTVGYQGIYVLLGW